MLAHGIARSEIPVCRMFTGHRGVGKTTELKRVKRMLEKGEVGRPMFVSFLEAEQWLDLQDVQAPDIIFHMVRQLVDDLSEAGFGLGRAKFEQFFGEIKGLLNSEVEFQSIKVPAGIVEFGLALKDVPRARPTLRKLIEGHLPTIYDLINQVVLTKAREWLKENGLAEDILVIVDELDRIPQKVIDPKGLTNQRNIYLDHAAILRSLGCHVLYTVPIELAFSDAHLLLKAAYGCETLLLPLIPVSQRNNEDCLDGIHALCRIVRERIAKTGATPQQVFEDDVLEQLCRVSGGYIRSLFILLRSAIERCDSLPITKDVAERTVRRQAIDLSLALRPRHREALRAVHKSKAAFSEDSELWNLLLGNLMALPYEDESGVWYDWNPLIAAVPGGV
ncbi:MAG TPA: hypothetical protein VMQ86_20910 [Bryobacteraceae bacterium]|nr:hypothetical protein [Bryobacteraceae bacterium]